ncbi:hypothetical protein ACUN7V_20200 [Quadrisphaera oryzae]|uniref:hypothetical protein n=1 Tax=Quadrisphaera TaxID=317661 RepID=UPI0016481EF1|nr:hypothetical protein [Quadrisphaera sp. RL12-1S]MBC3763447.1 hypothetical protein [Quadrisphaera sp. RL12-1S]
MTTPTTSEATELTEGPTTEIALKAARQLLTALAQHGRDEGERTRAEIALAHLDDVWPLPVPVNTADVEDIDERGALLLDEAMSALVTVVATAPEAQARARGLRALELLTSTLELPGDMPPGTPPAQQ